MVSVKITPEAYAAKSEELRTKEGVIITGLAGSVNKSGVELSYTYDGTTLSVNVLSAPPFMKGHVEKEITSWLTS